MTDVITGPCTGVKDKACAGDCPAGRICEGERMLCIHSGECAGCGPASRCAPGRGDRLRRRRARAWAQFTAANAKFSGQFGCPGAPARPARCPTTPAMSLATSPAGNATMSARQIPDRGRVSGGPVPGSPGRPLGSR